MGKAHPIWRDIIAARPDMTEEQAKAAAEAISNSRSSMLHRCNNPGDKDYHRYGGRGIAVCPEWSDPVTGLRDFAVWSVTHGWSKDLTIERNDNNAGYTTDNCRWATRAEQAYNRYTNMSINLDIPVKILMWMLKLNGIKFAALIKEGKTAIEDKLVELREKELNRIRDSKERLNNGCCPCCGEPAEYLYRSKSNNHKWVVIGCHKCVRSIDIYTAAVEAGVFDT